MTAASDWTSELPPLLERLIDGQFSPEDGDRLNALLAQGDPPRRYYRSYLKLHAALEWRIGEYNMANGFAEPTPCTADQRPPASPPVSIATESPSSPPIAFPVVADYSTAGYFSSGWPVAYLIATVLFAIGLTIAAIVHVSPPGQQERYVDRPSTPQSPNPNPSTAVARVTAMVDCQWEESRGRVQGSDSGQWPVASGQKPSSHQPLSTSHYPLATVSLGDRFALKSGLLEITYDTGAKVILQGPVTYEVASPTGGYLSVGKLTARLEKRSAVSGQRSETPNPQSLIPNPSLSPAPCPLFAVRTPTAIVTDLGTEFGVEVDEKGGTKSHVFRGSVRVQKTLPEGAPDGAGRVLRENESTTVERKADGRIVLLDTQDRVPAFVRKIPAPAKPEIKTVDLVDVVAGGDGFSGRRNRGLDPTTGRTVDALPTSKILVSDGRYHRVEGLPFVDGVFVPGSRRASVQTDSAGHTFDRFGSSMNETWQPIWAGGAIPANDSRRESSAALGGVDYSSSGHGLLHMHANKGITFDLDAIRRAHPGQRIAQFRAVVGNTEAPVALVPTCIPKPLLAQDFETTPAGDVHSFAPLASRGPSSPGVLQAANHKTVAQIVAGADHKTNAAGTGNRYVKVRSGWILANGWTPSDTDNQIVQVSASVLVSSEPGSEAFVHAFPRPALYELDYAFAVCLAADGAVTHYNGRELVRTDLVSRPDVWQHLVITANMASRTFSVKLDDQPLFRNGLWLGSGRRVDHLLIGNNLAKGEVSFDNIAMDVQQPAGFRGHEPDQLSADAWVLIDGERRAGRRGFHLSSGPYSLSVPIADNDRFLTLVATDAGDSAFWDSVFFGDPRLELRNP